MKDSDSIDIRKEVTDFIEEDSQTGEKPEDLIEKAVKATSQIVGLVDEANSYEKTLALLQDTLKSDPQLDVGEYNFDIAFLAIRVVFGLK